MRSEVIGKDGSRKGLRPVIITCAVTGSADTVGRNPAVPVTPEQIVREIVLARAAGAAVAHIHVRDPATGKASRDIELYRAVVRGVREQTPDVLVNLTTGPGARFVPNDQDIHHVGLGTTLSSPESRMEHVLELRPDICSLDLGTLNYGSGTLVNTPRHIRIMARLAQSVGVKPELEVFDTGHLVLAKRLLEEGSLPKPPLIQLCLGIEWGAPSTTEVLLMMKHELPSDASWCAFGISRHQFPMAAQSIVNGGHVRVGLEDNIYISKGRLATGNAQLVERAVQIIELLDCRVASPDEARALLSLRPAAEPTGA